MITFHTLNSVDLLFYNENNPRKHLYNISKSLPRKTAYSLSYIRIECWLKIIAKDSNGWKHFVRLIAVAIIFLQNAPSSAIHRPRPPIFYSQMAFVQDLQLYL